MLRLLKRLVKKRKEKFMAKRNKAKARAMRSGTSPYVKYQKREYQYSAEYLNWKRAHMAGGKRDTQKNKYAEASPSRQWLQAAE